MLMTENKSDRFLQDIIDIKREGISEHIRHQTLRCLADYLGAIIAGSKILSDKGQRIIESLNDDGPCPIVGYGRKGGLLCSAIVNGLSSHTAELDDGVISGIIHPGAPVFTTLFSLASGKNISFDDFMIGAVIGYETSVRLANAIQPSHKLLGYHATATCGTIGAAVGGAAMLGYNDEQIKSTFSFAISSSHGTLKVLEDSSELKPFNVGTAALNAVVAVIMGKIGMNGPEDPLEGYAGFLKQHSNQVREDLLYRNKGDNYAIENVYIKPYAACRYCHPSIENALGIMKDSDIDTEKIESIEIATYALAVNKHDQKKVSNVASAKMSIPFATAVTFCKGNAGVEAYTDQNVNDPRINTLMQKVNIHSDDAFSKAFPHKSIATMVVTMKDGTIFESKTELPKGESVNPLSDEEIIEKLLSLCAFYGMEQTQANQLARTLFAKQRFDIDTILNLLP